MPLPGQTKVPSGFVSQAQFIEKYKDAAYVIITINDAAIETGGC
jgi:hypothetical protein